MHPWNLGAFLMTNIKRVAIVLALLAAGTALYIVGMKSKAEDQARAAADDAAWQAKIAQAKRSADLPLQPRVLNVGESASQVVVLDIPSVSRHGFTTTQRCYVWRDAELRVASIACPSEGAYSGE